MLKTLRHLQTKLQLNSCFSDRGSPTDQTVHIVKYSQTLHSLGYIFLTDST